MHDLIGRRAVGDCLVVFVWQAFFIKLQKYISCQMSKSGSAERAVMGLY